VPAARLTFAVPAPGGPLFDADLPGGFHYNRDFISAEEEAALADTISSIELANFELRGVVARRRVAFFGRTYDTGDGPSPPLPEFLFPLRERLAAWGRIEPAAFAMALINEYVPGAPIGWHRDAPQYDIVAGVSLLSECRMKFRPYLPSGEPSPRRRTATHEITLERRSAYLMTGEARSRYEHHIPAVASLRYSITFRTVRPGRASGRVRPGP
jgi:alkylated DNA repair dioxygenase AlkB